MSHDREGQADGPETPIPALFAHLVDDISLLLPRASVPPMAEVVHGYIEARDGRYGGLTGQLVCPVSRLSEMVSELARLAPVAPVDLSLVVDTGLGALPKALSLVMSREALLSPCTVETAAPPDVDSTWLERVSEFVPEDVIRVVEPRRGVGWLDGVRKVIEHGSWPKIRCGGVSSENFPSVDEVADFLSVVSGFGGASFKATNSLHRAVRHQDAETGFEHHGFLNLLVAVGRCLSGGDVRDALSSTDAQKLSDEARNLSEQASKAVRALFASYASADFDGPVTDLEALGLL